MSTHMSQPIDPLLGMVIEQLGEGGLNARPKGVLDLLRFGRGGMRGSCVAFNLNAPL